MATIESEIVTNIAQNTSDEAIEDTEEGEILEDGEIADEDDTSVVVVAAVEKKEEIKHEEKENKSNKDRDLRKREESTKRDRDREKGRDRDKEKDKDKEKEKERDRSERRHSYDRNVDRDKKSAERDRKSSNEDEREKRRRERERKRRRSEEEDEREKSQSQSQSRKRSRDNWNSESSFDSNSRTTFEEYARKPEEDEDMPFDDRVFDEMIGMMDNRVPINREGLHAEKRGLMRAMAIMMRRNAENEKSRRTGRLVRDKRRPERTPGPTGTRASRQHTERLQSTPVFKAQCKFFIEGKCHKGADCSFSHDCLPAKKKEICKFYLQGFCGKGEDCLYMHNEFPCKFFHTNVECYSGENCRFSHAPLNEETREILRNYLDSGQLPDDPKPEKNNDTPKNEIKSLPNDMYSSSPNNSIQNSQQSATSTSPATSSSTYAPMKPVAKRHAILGDATNDMKSSYYTWVWQQEMKELEVAYVGNKRNLFCIEKPFVMSDKPPTPRIEDDEDEIEAQIRSYYLDTMGTMGIEEEEDNNNNNNNMPNIVKSEEQKLIEASAHDEDLRTFFMPSQTGLNDSSDNAMIKKEVKTDNDLRPKIDDSLNTNNAPSHSKSDSSMNLPKIESENKNASKVNVKQEPKSWLDDSDDDDKDDHVLAAALKNIESKTVQPNSDTSQDKSLSSLDISKMLSAIRQSSNPASSSTTNNLSKQTEFWQNILSGINLAGGSPSGNNTPPRHGYRDPRLKRGKDSSSPTPETTPILKICDPSVQIDYKLVPITITGIDYSCYVSIFRNDSRLKNDPRLSKFFSKLPTTEIDNLSRIIPPPLKTAPVTPLSVLKSKKRSEREKKESHRKAKPSSSAPMPPLPPLPPLTISPSKSAPTPGIIPPPPPPIMSPLELISSRPSFTVRESKSVNKTANDTDICEKLDIKSALLLSHSASSPEPAVESDDKTVTMKQETEIETTNPPYVPLDLNISSLNTVTTNSKPLTSVDTTKSSLSSQSSLKASDSDRYTPPLSSYNLNIKKESEELNDQTSKDDDLYDISFLSVNYDSLNNGQQTGVHSPPSDKNELQLICNELQSPIIDSDPEMEIDMTVNRKDSVSEMESSDECELTIASSSETEDNVNNDTESNNNNNNSNLPIDTILKPSNALLIDEPINLTVNDDSNNKDNVEQSDQSLKSVFSVIDPTASPFC